MASGHTNIIMMDLHIKPMKKNIYITPSVEHVYIAFEGLLCISTFKQYSMFIDDVDEGADYGYL